MIIGLAIKSAMPTEKSRSFDMLFTALRATALVVGIGVVANQHAKTEVGNFFNLSWYNGINAALNGDGEYFASQYKAATSFIAGVLGDGEVEQEIVALKTERDYEEFQGQATPTLKSLIRKGESGARGYNSYNRGSTSCAKSNKDALPLTEMTIAQVQKYQSLPTCHKQKLLAVGHYQIVPKTLNNAIAAMKIPRNAKFTPELQDSIFAFYLTQGKQPAIRQYITTGKGIKRAAHAVAGEWAIFQSVYTNRGVYDKVGTNHARIKAEKVVQALYRGRMVFTELVNAGFSTNDAYAKAVGL